MKRTGVMGFEAIMNCPNTGVHLDAQNPLAAMIALPSSAEFF